MHVKVRKKRWKLEFQNLSKKDHWGFCDDPLASNKRVVVDKHLFGQHRMEIVLHELLHAALWDLDEQTILETAHDLARVLWRLGYRCPEDKQKLEG